MEGRLDNRKIRNKDLFKQVHEKMNTLQARQVRRCELTELKQGMETHHLIVHQYSYTKRK